MLDTLPYADLLAIHNVLAEKPARRFDTRANGERRTAALMQERGLTLEEAARLADVILRDPGSGEGPDATEPDDATGRRASGPMDRQPPVMIEVEADLAPLVNRFITELMKPEPPPYIAAFLRRLNVDGPPRDSTPRERQLTPSQRKIVELCSRPEGATGKELAEACGWPSIAARTTCRKLADRSGFALEESPKSNGRGISFRMIAASTTADTAA
jgi:hypothetical protein